MDQRMGMQRQQMQETAGDNAERGVGDAEVKNGETSGDAEARNDNRRTTGG